MKKYRIVDEIFLSQAPVGPLAAHLEAFAKSLSSQGYSEKSIHRQVLVASCFSQWLKDEGVALFAITSAHPAQYLRFRAARVQLHQGDAAALAHVLAWLSGTGLIPIQKIAAPRPTAAERFAKDYEQHLLEARGLAAATIASYGPLASNFLVDRFGAGPLTLSRLSARDVVKFVERQAPHLHPKRAKLLTSALRSFLQYARYRGKVKLDLAAAVPVVPNWSMSSVPRAISTSQIRQLLTSIDRRTAVGRRDYTILLLLARLGLRSGEVVSLTLDDIDWQIGALRVRGKCGQRNELPLPAEVGRAIAAYLRHGRPHTTTRQIFLRARAPFRGFRNSSAVGSIVRHRIQRAGLDTPTLGTHQFRHGLACNMLRQGASLDEIGELLGHRNPQTTTIYAKVDIDALRTLALPWPGGVR